MWGEWGGLSDPWSLGQLKGPSPAAKGQSPGQAAGKEPQAVGFPASLSCSKHPSCRATIPMASGPDRMGHSNPRRAEGWGSSLARHSRGTWAHRPSQLAPSSSSWARSCERLSPDLTDPFCSIPSRYSPQCHPTGATPSPKPPARLRHWLPRHGPAGQQKPGQPRLLPLSFPGSWEGVIGEAGD